MFNYDETLLTERENKIIDVWSKIYNAFNSVDFKDNKWIVSGPDYSEEFADKESMLEMLEIDIKETLFGYAINGDIDVEI